MTLYAFDGTWASDEDVAGEVTNVVKFYKAYRGDYFYFEGIGAQGNIFLRSYQGKHGVGGEEKVADALEKLASEAQRRDDTQGGTSIDIVGFSRGAALALQFANEVQKKHPEQPIRFLGLWDTVASFGANPYDRINIGWTLTLPDNVERCCHAMALDEQRNGFHLIRVESPAGGRSAEGRLEEVWFRGVHSDVGGSGNEGLSSITLCWMLQQAKAVGLPIGQDTLDEHARACIPGSEVSKNVGVPWGERREPRAGDTFHESARV